jgi:hypothetical protein
VAPVAVADRHLMTPPPPRRGAAVELLQAPGKEAGEAAEQPHTEAEKRAEPDVAHPAAASTARLAIHRRPASTACLKPGWSRCAGAWEHAMCVRAWASCYIYMLTSYHQSLVLVLTNRAPARPCRVASPMM